MKKIKWTNNEIEEINLIYTPHTKELLKNYVGIMYEENAVYTDESLKAELLLLYRNNDLAELITAEWICSEKRLKAECEE